MHAGEGVPNTNFTQAWLAQNAATASFVPRFNGAAYIPRINGAAYVAHGVNGAGFTHGGKATAKQ